MKTKSIKELNTFCIQKERCVNVHKGQLCGLGSDSLSKTTDPAQKSTQQKRKQER